MTDPVRTIRRNIVAKVLKDNSYRMSCALAAPEEDWTPMWHNVADEILRALEVTESPDCLTGSSESDETGVSARATAELVAQRCSGCDELFDSGMVRHVHADGTSHAGYAIWRRI